MEWFAASWRDAVMLVIALIGVYLVLMVMRLFQVGKSAPVARAQPARERLAPTLEEPEHAEPGFADEDDTVAPPELDEVVETSNRLSALIGKYREPALPVARVPEPIPAAAATATSRKDFAGELARSSLEVEVQQLRRESAHLKQQLTNFQLELAQLKATRNVSPLYSEAVSLAQRGVTADGIASQCGISLGEAELVAALARMDTDQLETDEDGNGGEPGPGRRTGTDG